MARVAVIHPTPAFRHTLSRVLGRRGHSVEDFDASWDPGPWIEGAMPSAVAVLTDTVKHWDLLGVLGAAPTITTIAMLSEEDHFMFALALRLGVDGVAAATDPVNELANVIENALAGRAVVPSAVLREILDGSLVVGPDLGRDVRLLQMLAEGVTMARVAASMHVSKSTARRAVHDLLERMGMPHVQSAIALAARHGLVDIRPRDLRVRSGSAPGPTGELSAS